MAVTSKEDLMETLFVTASQKLIARLKSGDATPADFKNAIQLLKDNGITCDVRTGPNDLMKELLAELPFSEEEMN